MSDDDGGNRRRDAVFGGTPLPPPGMPPATPQSPQSPQYGPYGGEPPTMPTWSAGEPLASPTASPLAPPAGQGWYVAPPARKNRRGRAIVATVGAIAVLAGGTFAAVSLSGSDGAATPSAAVAGFFEALDHEDVLGMLNALPAGERDALQPLAEKLTSEVERLGITKKVDLGLVKGLDIQVDGLRTHSEDLGDGVGAVWIDSGTITVNVVPQDVPIGDNLKNLIEHVTGSPVTITATSDNQSMHMEASSSPIVTIKDGDGWKLSAFYTMAEAIRRDSNAALPAFGQGVDAVGSDSPEAAVRAFADALVALDVEKMVALTPPEEMQALHDYAPLFLPEVTSDMDGSGFSMRITRLDMTPSGSGDRQSVAVTGLAVHFESDEGQGDVDFDGKCFTLTGDLANAGEGGTEEQCPGDIAGVGGDSGLDDLTGRVGNPLAITVVKEGEEWYVSPIGTLGDSLLGALHVLEPEDFQDGGLVYKLIDGLQSLDSESRAREATDHAGPAAVITTIVTAAVIAFFGLRLVQGARYSVGGDGRQRVLEIVRGIRFRHVWPVPIVLALVLAAAVSIVQIPGLAWGWWTALGGQGNPAFGSNDQTTGTPLEWLLPTVFILLLVPALPLFALREEQMFRRGAERWSWPKRVLMALAFGLVHAIVGIPIGVALALSIGGAYFQLVYLRQFRQTGSQREALLESTRAHTTYNGLIVIVVLVVLVLSVVTGSF